MMKSIVSIMLLTILLAVDANGNDGVYEKTPPSGVGGNRHEKAVFGSWHVRCQRSNKRSSGFCHLESLSGDRYPNGAYKTVDGGPKITISADSGPRVNLTNNVKPGQTARINTDNSNHHVTLERKGFPEWRGSSANEIIQAFKDDSKGSFRYVNVVDTYMAESFSLVGFTRALEYSLTYCAGNR